MASTRNKNMRAEYSLEQNNNIGFVILISMIMEEELMKQIQHI